MTRTAIVLLAVAVSFLSGCQTSLQSIKERRAKDKPRGKAVASSTLLVRDPSTSGPVLRVNEEALTVDDFWRHEQSELAKYRALGLAEYRSYVERRAAKLIPDRITEMLLYQHASLRLPPEAEKNIEKYLDGHIRRTITADYDGVQRVYDRHLAKLGMTLEDVRAQLRREVIIASFLEDDIKPKVAEPTRAELMAAFKSNEDKWQRPPKRYMSLIDIRKKEQLPEGVSRPTPEQETAARDAALAIARSVEQELLGGAEFSELARQHSNGLHAHEGGSWGSVATDSVRERFAPAVDALYKLQQGQVSAIIETEDCFFVVRCDEVDPGAQAQFVSVQAELKQFHYLNTYNRLVAELVEELQRTARIEEDDLIVFYGAAVEAALADVGG